MTKALILKVAGETVWCMMFTLSALISFAFAAWWPFAASVGLAVFSWWELNNACTDLANHLDSKHKNTPDHQPR